MKYFTYDLIAAANDWIEQAEQARLTAEQRFLNTVKDYRRSLFEVKPRISTTAWEFFDSGNGPSGLHDGRLASLSIGAMVWTINQTAPLLFGSIIKGPLLGSFS